MSFLALVLPLLVIGVVVVLASLLGLGQPDLSLQRGLRILSPGLRCLPVSNGLFILGQLLLTALVTTPLLWEEEFGWRSYLQLCLLRQRPLLAALATGLIWGIWHYPIILTATQHSRWHQRMFAELSWHRVESRTIFDPILRG